MIGVLRKSSCLMDSVFPEKSGLSCNSEGKVGDLDVFSGARVGFAVGAMMDESVSGGGYLRLRTVDEKASGRRKEEERQSKEKEGSARDGTIVLKGREREV